MKKVFMLSTLSIWEFGVAKVKAKTAGNQTLFNTLKGYSDNGIKVYVLTFNDSVEVGEPFPNVFIRKSIMFNIFSPIFVFISNLKRRLSLRNNQKKRKKVTTDIIKTGSKRLYYMGLVFGLIEGFIRSLIIKPDLYYGYEIYCSKPATILSKLFRRPSVTRFQGTELGFLLVDDNRFFSAKYILRGTKANSDLVIMANDGTDGDLVLNKLGIPIKKSVFWSNGLHDKNKYLSIENNPDYKDEMGISNDTFVITTANRFVDWKRIDRIIYAINELNKLKKKVVLIAIGDGYEREALESLVNSLELNNVKFLGALEHTETIYHIANSDLYITLNHSGNLGNSIYEALALGTFICTIKNESVEKVLSDSYNAILFDTLDEKLIAKKIGELIEDDLTRKNLSLNARNFAKEKLLSWPQRMILEVNEISKLIDQNRNHLV